MGGRFPPTWPSIPRRGGLDPWPVGKVALFLRPGQTGAQPRGPGHSTGPGIHGPRESGAGASLQATGLFILQTIRLRLEALNPGERPAQRRRGQGGLTSAGLSPQGGRGEGRAAGGGGCEEGL